MRKSTPPRPNGFPLPNGPTPMFNHVGVPLQCQYVSSSGQYSANMLINGPAAYQPVPSSFSVTVQPAQYMVAGPAFLGRGNHGNGGWPPMVEQRQQHVIAATPPRDRSNESSPPGGAAVAAQQPPKRERKPLPIINPKGRALLEFGENFSLILPIDRQFESNGGASGDNSDFTPSQIAVPPSDSFNRDFNHSRPSFGLTLPLVQEDSPRGELASCIQEYCFEEPVSTCSSVNSQIPQVVANDTESTSSPTSSVATVAESADFIDKLKSILKKLTPQSFDVSSERFLSLEQDMVTSGRTAEAVDVIFRKVSDEPRYCEMCAILCEMMTHLQASVSVARSKCDSFRYQLLNKCQAIFELSKNNDRFKECRLEEIEKEKEEETRNLLKTELGEIMTKRKWHILESIRFVGELCQRKLVSKVIAHLCIQHLLTKTNEFESLKCLCLFMRTVGKTLEEDKNSGNVLTYFQELNKILKSADTRKLPQRIRQEIKNLIELRKNNWVRERPDIETDFSFRTFECFICFEEVGHQKFLDCGVNAKKHILCEKCIRKLSTKASWSKTDRLVECPVCRSVTLLSGGVPTKLPTKFFVDLTCEDCSVSKPIEDQIWCKRCHVTICSNCAGHNHSCHECSQWEDYDVPYECLAVLKRDRSEQTTSKVKQFCAELQTALLQKLENSDRQSRRLVDAIEFGYGNLKKPAVTSSPSSTDRVDVEEKKLKVVTDILQSRNIRLDEFDVLREIVKFSADDLKLPSVDEVLSLMREKKE